MTSSSSHSAQTEPSEPTLPVVKRTSTRRRWWVSAALATLIFVSGAVTGGGLATLHIHHTLHDFLHHPDKIPDNVIPHLKRGLKLTDDQFQQVDRIIRSHHERLDRIRHEAVSQVQAEFESLDREMNEVLNGHQREKWKHRFHHVRELWFPLSNRPPID